MHQFNALPPLLTHFLLAALFSFVIGLEFHAYQRNNRHHAGFGTTRTFTMIGIFGFILYALDAHGLLFAVGLGILTVFLTIYYVQRIREANPSLIAPLLALMTYLLGAAAMVLPAWFLILFVVTLLLLLSEKRGIRHLSDTVQGEEMVTLSKFLIMAGVVLPLLPDKQIAPFITVTYYQVWLAILVVSTISYLSYLAQTYFFKQRGLLLTGLLGGLYSSTAATVVLARRAGAAAGAVSSAMILATAMMYLRLLVLILMLGGRADFMRLLAPFAGFALASVVAALVLQRRQGADAGAAAAPVKHPLEFGTAFVFALLFVAFTAITHYVVGDFGSSGLHVLAFAVGLTDIDPFILSLLAGKFHVPEAAILGAIVIASGSNNLLKAGYAVALGRNRAVVPAAAWLALLFVASLAYVWWL